MIRKEDLQVFSIAFTFLLLEITIFHILQFTHDYLESTLVISYAMLGLAIGSLVTYFYREKKTINFSLLVILLIASIVIAFINITQFPGFVHLSPLNIFPFLIGNIIVTFMFRTENVNRLYFFNLMGATCGIFFSIISIPLLKTEGTLILCIIILCFAGFMFNDSKRVKTNRVLRVAFRKRQIKNPCKKV
jgi:hypothetical protein